MTNSEGYRRILIVEVNWLGDVLFSTPFIRAVRERFRDAHIAVLVVPRCKEILERNPNIDEIITYDEKGVHRSPLGKLRLIASLRRKRFDLAILLHRSFTRTLMAFLSGIRERTGFATKKRRFLLTRPVEPPGLPLHKVEYFLKIAESLGCDVSNKDYDFFVNDAERKFVEKELSANGVQKGDFLVVIHPGANWAPKRWSEGSFAELCDVLIEKYESKVVASGAKRDEEIARRIKEKMKGHLAILSGRTSLKELAALMERADLVISGDSGPMHIAVAVKSNVIALFGPTSPALTGPYGRGKYKVIQKHADCETPCYDLTCSNHRCMNAITVEDVLKQCKELIKQK